MSSHSGLRILVVDDHPVILEHLRSYLTALGFDDVKQASSGSEALRRLRWPGIVDLVISDAEMSPLTGLDLLDCMRSDAALRTIPFIMMSAERDPSDVLAAKRAGASAYLVKPFSLRALSSAVTAALTRVISVGAA